MGKRVSVAVLGSGNIGSDLCERLLRDDRFSLVALIGRRETSEGLRRFSNRIEIVSSGGIEAMSSIWPKIDGFFDATSAESHSSHWFEAQRVGRFVIDLTPSKIGIPMVPVLAGTSKSFSLSTEMCSNYSMVTCGGQSSAPLVYALAKNSSGVTEIEVSSSIASLSAGPATRNNLDEYIQATEHLVSLISGCNSVKAILVLNPAEPPVMMRTTVHVRVKGADLDLIRAELTDLEHSVRRYVPGYEVVVDPHFVKDDVISATARVWGSGFYLPEYAGNLDIINAAAVETAYQHFVSFER